MTDIAETVTGYETVSLPHYSDHLLAKRAKVAIKDFNALSYSLTPPVRRIDVVETFLAAFLARQAEADGLPFKFFNLLDRPVTFYGWRTKKRHSCRFDTLNRFQKVRALQLFADSVPEPEWKQKGKKG